MEFDFTFIPLLEIHVPIQCYLALGGGGLWPRHRSAAKPVFVFSSALEEFYKINYSHLLRVHSVNPVPSLLFSPALIPRARASSTCLSSSLRLLDPQSSTFPQAQAAFDTHPEQHVLVDARLVVLDDVCSYYQLVSSFSKFDVCWSRPFICQGLQGDVKRGLENMSANTVRTSYFPTF